MLPGPQLLHKTPLLRHPKEWVACDRSPSSLVELLLMISSLWVQREGISVTALRAGGWSGAVVLSMWVATIRKHGVYTVTHPSSKIPVRK